ncbi:chemotaxis protein CheB [Asanoa sp. WMMD1127]|uniref:chemotaxis protein CheB n=1 Tax=Asanoa sp. WMMD1127 TaxID=3016107 RepID=UPI002417BB13|nr:chemotaxis protein CheB [Asanoa sp. WMMD1127]MDG4825812.1 chemotaxis protein CheB [Asanoa sp. WMMD1127]
MTPHVIVAGASAGGVEALRAMVAGLPADLPAAVLIVLHVPRTSPSALPAILSRAGKLPAHTARDGETLEHGHIYVAPADHHLLVLDHRLRLSRGPSENGHRPAIDPLFRSAARALGPRVVGVVLSGARDDGAAGLGTIAQRGGQCVVQEPDDALHASMPRAAMERVRVDAVASAAAMGEVLTKMVKAAAERLTAGDDESRPLLDGEIAMSELADLTSEDLALEPAGYGCPSCGGSLFEISDQPVPRYRCRVGHAWSPQSLLDEQAVALEGALWMALRALEDKASLSRRMAESGRRRHVGTEAQYTSSADEADRAASLIRDLIGRIGSTATEEAAIVPGLMPGDRDE